MSFAPFWWRFWQCLNKAYNSGNKWQLVNALKYVSKWGPLIAVLCGSNKTWYEKTESGEWIRSSSYWWYFTFQMITTLFCLYWDYYWDWGLLQGDSSEIGGNWYLRIKSKMTFSPKFYYFCVIENTLFRFWWLFASAGIQFGKQYQFLDQMEFLVMIGVLVELTRRWIWAILRVENEFHNNLEQYRDILAIPPIKEED